MGLTPSSLEYGRIDSPFDNGAGRLTLPIEYHPLFQLARTLLPQVVAARSPAPNGVVNVHLNPFILVSFDRLILDLLRHIAFASYGGAPPNLNALSSLRPGSLEEIGLIPPPILEYYRLYNSTNGSQSRLLRLPMHEEAFRNWMQTFLDAIRNTREWLSVAQRRVAFLRGLTGWNWTSPKSNSRAPPYNPHDPRLPLAPNSSGPLALIPHPVLGPNAKNAVVPLFPQHSPDGSTTPPVVPPNYYHGASSTQPPSAVTAEASGSGSSESSFVKEEDLTDLDDLYDFTDDDIRSDVGTYHSTDSEASSDDEDMYYDESAEKPDGHTRA
ncbi:hypothetical protein LXA43DRAFT_1103179 [Ganoderma leucocontextum]|nr:hypothetical protein LXA43DRAFT_1103179 [Ganoderma leucocontextum]